MFFTLGQMSYFAYEHRMVLRGDTRPDTSKEGYTNCRGKQQTASSGAAKP